MAKSVVAIAVVAIVMSSVVAASVLWRPAEGLICAPEAECWRDECTIVEGSLEWCAVAGARAVFTVVNMTGPGEPALAGGWEAVVHSGGSDSDGVAWRGWGEGQVRCAQTSAGGVPACLAEVVVGAAKLGICKKSFTDALMGGLGDVLAIPSESSSLVQTDSLPAVLTTGPCKRVFFT